MDADGILMSIYAYYSKRNIYIPLSRMENIALIVKL